MNALEAALMMPRYEAMMVEELKTSHPAEVQGKSDDELAIRVRQGTARARAHGFVELAACGQFVGLEVELGVGFDKAAWAAAILADRKAGDARIDALLAEADDHTETP